MTSSSSSDRKHQGSLRSFLICICFFWPWHCAGSTNVCWNTYTHTYTQAHTTLLKENQWKEERNPEPLTYSSSASVFWQEFSSELRKAERTWQHFPLYHNLLFLLKTQTPSATKTIPERRGLNKETALDSLAKKCCNIHSLHHQKLQWKQEEHQSFCSFLL